jgi:hypothetical protein
MRQEGMKTMTRKHAVLLGVGAMALVAVVALGVTIRGAVGEAEPPAPEYPVADINEESAIQTVLATLHEIDPSMEVTDMTARRMLYGEFQDLMADPTSGDPLFSSSIDRSGNEVWIVAFRTEFRLEATGFADVGDPPDEMQEYYEGDAYDWFHSADDGYTTAYLVMDAYNGEIYEEAIHGPWFQAPDVIDALQSVAP